MEVFAPERPRGVGDHEAAVTRPASLVRATGMSSHHFTDNSV